MKIVEEGSLALIEEGTAESKLGKRPINFSREFCAPDFPAFPFPSASTPCPSNQ